MNAHAGELVTTTASTPTAPTTPTAAAPTAAAPPKPTPPTKATTFVEEAGLFRNVLNKARRHRMTNPGSNLWPHGQIKYKYTAKLAGTFSTLAAPAQTVRATYEAAMESWEKGTCINFIPEGTATLEYQWNEVDSQASCNGGVGSIAKSVIIPSGDDKVDTCQHELGHAIGLKHTNTRSDRDQYLTFTEDTCYDDFGTHYCAPNVISATLKGFTNPNCDVTTDLPVDVKTKLKITGTYSKANQTQLQQCQQHYCSKLWIGQYTQNTYDLASSKYEYASIMHYPIVSYLHCIAIKMPKKDDTVGNGVPPGTTVTTNDLEVVNRHYKCRKLSVTNPTDNTVKTAWVHPDLTLTDAAARITTLTGIALPQGKKFQVKVGTTPHDVSGAGTVSSVLVDATFGTAFTVAVV